LLFIYSIVNFDKAQYNASNDVMRNKFGKCLNENTWHSLAICQFSCQGQNDPKI